MNESNSLSKDKHLSLKEINISRYSVLFSGLYLDLSHRTITIRNLILHLSQRLGESLYIQKERLFLVKYHIMRVFKSYLKMHHTDSMVICSKNPTMTSQYTRTWGLAKGRLLRVPNKLYYNDIYNRYRYANGGSVVNISLVNIWRDPVISSNYKYYSTQTLSNNDNSGVHKEIISLKPRFPEINIKLISNIKNLLQSYEQIKSKPGRKYDGRNK